MKKMKKLAGKMEKGKTTDKDICNDIACPVHGNLSIRGRTFNGKVIKKFHKRIVIEFERTVYVRKYERYVKYKTKIHARLPPCMEKEVDVGDYVKVQECRPLSKIVHSVFINKIKRLKNESN